MESSTYEGEDYGEGEMDDSMLNSNLRSSNAQGGGLEKRLEQIK